MTERFVPSNYLTTNSTDDIKTMTQIKYLREKNPKERKIQMKWGHKYNGDLNTLEISMQQ